MKVTSADKMKETFKEKDDKYHEWATRETKERKAGEAVMVPLVISHVGAVQKDAIKRWKTSLKISTMTGSEWPKMSSDVTSSLWGSSSTKGSWVSEAWRKEHPEEFEEEQDDPPERIPTADERRELLNVDLVPESAVCVRSPGTPPPHNVRLKPVE